MKLVTRRVFAVVGALLIPYIALRWGYFAAGYAQALFHHVHDVASVIGKNAVYAKFGDLYTFLGLVGLALAAGISFALFMWDARPSQTRIKIIYAVFLAAILPLAVLNYTQGDIFISRYKQALVDLVLVFLGAVACINLAEIHLHSTPAKNPEFQNFDLTNQVGRRLGREQAWKCALVARYLSFRNPLWGNRGNRVNTHR